MASGWYTTGLRKLLDGTIDIDTSTLKVMLVKTSYSFARSEDVVSTALTAAEISGVSGYTRGFNGAGRKTAVVTLQSNDTDNRVDIALDDIPWTALGTGDTIGFAVLIWETGSDDTTAVPIACWDVTDTPTNGSDITLDFLALGSGGNLRIAISSS